MHVPFGRPAVAILLTLAFGACGAQRSSNRAASGDREEITQDQILKHRFINAYEAVEALHSNWLRPKGTDSFNSPSQVWVYYDNTRLGGVESLRSIAVSTISYIHHFDAVSATARWGIDHGQGVIFVSSRPR